MSGGWFVTGTDTEVGKTFASCALLHRLRAEGLIAVGMKPVAAGASRTPDGLRNEDVEALIAAGSFPVERSLLNPYLFEEPMAPHIAAARQGVTIRPEPVMDAYRELAQRADAVVVEGVGGFRVPLSPDFDTAMLAQRLRLPLVIVVGMRLGCINHALLTAEAIARRDLVVAGWIANRIDRDMRAFDENLDALKERLGAPLLGVLPWMDPPDPAVAAGCLSLPDRPASSTAPA